MPFVLTPMATHFDLEHISESACTDIGPLHRRQQENCHAGTSDDDDDVATRSSARLMQPKVTFDLVTRHFQDHDLISKKEALPILRACGFSDVECTEILHEVAPSPRFLQVDSQIATALLRMNLVPPTREQADSPNTFEMLRNCAHVQRCMRRILHSQLAGAFNSFVDRVCGSKEKRMACTKVMHHTLIMDLTAAFDLLCDSVAQLKAHRQAVERAIRCRRGPRMVLYFDRWVEATEESRIQVQVAAQQEALLELKHALEAERDRQMIHTQIIADKESHQRLETCEKMVRRAIRTRLANAFCCYREHVAEVAWRRKTCARIAKRMLHVRLAAAFGGFTEAVELLAEHRQVAAKIIGRWQNRVLPKMLRRWMGHMDQVRFESGRNGREVTKLALAEEPWQCKTIARNEAGVRLDTCECTTGSTAAFVASVAVGSPDTSCVRDERQQRRASVAGAATRGADSVARHGAVGCDMSHSMWCSEEQAFQRLRVSGSTGEGWRGATVLCKQLDDIFDVFDERNVRGLVVSTHADGSQDTQGHAPSRGDTQHLPPGAGTRPLLAPVSTWPTATSTRTTATTSASTTVTTAPANTATVVTPPRLTDSGGVCNKSVRPKAERPKALKALAPSFDLGSDWEDDSDALSSASTPALHLSLSRINTPELRERCLSVSAFSPCRALLVDDSSTCSASGNCSPTTTTATATAATGRDAFILKSRGSKAIRGVASPQPGTAAADKGSSVCVSAAAGTPGSTAGDTKWQARLQLVRERSRAAKHALQEADRALCVEKQEAYGNNAFKVGGMPHVRRRWTAALASEDNKHAARALDDGEIALSAHGRAQGSYHMCLYHMLS